MIVGFLSLVGKTRDGHDGALSPIAGAFATPIGDGEMNDCIS